MTPTKAISRGRSEMVYRSVRDPSRSPSEPLQPQTEVEVLVVAAERRVEHRTAVERGLAESGTAIEGGRGGYPYHITWCLGISPEGLTAVALYREPEDVEGDTATVHGVPPLIHDGPLHRCQG